MEQYKRTTVVELASTAALRQLSGISDFIGELIREIALRNGQLKVLILNGSPKMGPHA